MIRLLSAACCLAAAVASAAPVSAAPALVAPALVASASVASALATPVLTAAPALNCRRTRDQVDRAICASPESLSLEAEITALYGRGMATFGADDRHHLAQSQIAYIHKRKGCDWASHQSAHPGAAIDECVHAMMEERLHALRHYVDLGRY